MPITRPLGYGFLGVCQLSVTGSQPVCLGLRKNV